MLKHMTTFGYTRISTSGQDAQLQLDALREVGIEAQNIHSDVITGTSRAAVRPGMHALLEQLAEGDTVVVWRVDRLGRSLIDVLNTVDLLKARGVGIRSISDGIDPRTSSGRLLLNLLATLAEYERELIVERVNAGIAVARRSGVRFGRPHADPVAIAAALAVIEHARREGQTVVDAAALVGWSRATYYRWRARSPQ